MYSSSSSLSQSQVSGKGGIRPISTGVVARRRRKRITDRMRRCVRPATLNNNIVNSFGQNENVLLTNEFLTGIHPFY